jgi:hypothetical protein
MRFFDAHSVCAELLASYRYLKTHAAIQRNVPPDMKQIWGPMAACDLIEEWSGNLSVVMYNPGCSQRVSLHTRVYFFLGCLYTITL